MTTTAATLTETRAGTHPSPGPAGGPGGTQRPRYVPPAPLSHRPRRYYWIEDAAALAGTVLLIAATLTGCAFYQAARLTPAQLADAGDVTPPPSEWRTK